MVRRLVRVEMEMMAEGKVCRRVGEVEKRWVK